VSDVEKGINAPMSDEVWKFVLSLSTKLEEKQVPMLFEEDKVSPTTNLLVDMLNCHKIRTTYDFEKAVGRTFNMNESKWDFRLIDKLAGKGTATDTIFILKEKGNFSGAKRKLKFPRNEMPPRKCTRVNEMCNLFGSLDIDEESSKPTEWKGSSKPIDWKESSKPIDWEESSKTIVWKESSKPIAMKESSKPTSVVIRSQGRETLKPVNSLKVSESRCGWSGARKVSPKKSPTSKHSLNERRDRPQKTTSPKTPVTKKTKPKGERKNTMGRRTPVASTTGKKESILRFLHRTPGVAEDGQPSSAGES